MLSTGKVGVPVWRRVKLINKVLTEIRQARSVKTEIAVRELSIEVAHNIRHLGGYRTREGGHTASTDLIRSATLHRLTERGIETIVERGVRTIIDFRSEEERERDVTPETSQYGIKNVHAPVFRSDASPTGLGNKEFPGYGFVYQRFLEIGADAYRTLFETIADTHEGVLFHCAAGKDRTGVAAALLLEVSGAEHDEIVSDYVRTTELLQPLAKEWMPDMKKRGIDEERAGQLLGAPREAIETALATIREHHGGAETYLRGIGVSELVISAVRARITGTNGN